MPKITAQGKIFECEQGANLRQVLLKNKINPHNGNASLINCRGLGSCGTCAITINGEVSHQNWREKARLSLPPHKDKTRRLACQVQVLGDIEVIKFDGFWGQSSTVQWS